jgi:hypothetical protein
MIARRNFIRRAIATIAALPGKAQEVANSVGTGHPKLKVRRMLAIATCTSMTRPASLRSEFQGGAHTRGRAAVSDVAEPDRNHARGDRDAPQLSRR